MSTVIEVDKISKSFQKRPDEKIIAVDKVSFKVKKGEAIGLYGVNGSGKTTVLRLLSGILKPDKGLVKVKGRLVSVIELGLGLHPDLSGRENIYLYGLMQRMTLGEIKNVFDKIVEFSGLVQDIDLPIKKYSTGMKARLAFSVMLYSRAQVYLLDEVLAVGDDDFNIKSLRALKKIKKKNTMVIASHNLSLLMNICDRVMSINRGRIYSGVSKEDMHVRDFIEDYIKNKGIIRVESLSDSMSPEIKKGQKITLKRVEFSNLRQKDIVAIKFKSLSHFIVHRIVGEVKVEKEKGFITKGDANYSIDPWVIMEKDYVGVVVK